MDAISLYKAFKLAIDKEHEAAKFYADLASRVTDEELKNLLAGFATEEKKHFDRLTELYNKMKEDIAEE